MPWLDDVIILIIVLAIPLVIIPYFMGGPKEKPKRD